MENQLNSEIKLITKHSSIYGLANFIQRAIALLMLPVYTRFLNTSDYGMLEILYFVVTFVSIIMGLGISEAMGRFYYDSDSANEKNKVISTTIVGFGSISIIVGLLLFFISDFMSVQLFSSSEFVTHFKLIFIILACEFMVQSGLAFLRVKQKSSKLLFFSITHLLTSITLNVLFLVIFKMGVLGILLGTLIANVIVGGTMMFIIINQVGFNFSSELYKKMIKYGMPLIPSSLSEYIIIASDRFFLKELSGLHYTGIYSIGYKIGATIHRFVTSPFIQIWYPRRFESYENENSQQTYGKIFTYFTWILIFVGLGIVLLSEDLIKIITPQEYWIAFQVVPIIVLAHIFHSFYYHFSVEISYHKKTIYFAYINISTAVMNLVLNYFLIKSYNLWGAAYATLLTYFIRVVLIYNFSRKLAVIHFEKLRIFKMLLAAGIIFYLSSNFELDNPLANMSLKVLMLLLYPFILYVFKFYTDSEIDSIVNQAKKLKLKLLN
jgi:O-antigen/teichoic acid export membrane protein